MIPSLKLKSSWRQNFNLKNYNNNGNGKKITESKQPVDANRTVEMASKSPEGHRQTPDGNNPLTTCSKSPS